MTDISTWANTVQYLHQLPNADKVWLFSLFLDDSNLRKEKMVNGKPLFQWGLARIEGSVIREPLMFNKEKCKDLLQDTKDLFVHWYRPVKNRQLCWKECRVTVDTKSHTKKKYTFILHETDCMLDYFRKSTTIRPRAVIMPSSSILVTPYQENYVYFGPSQRRVLKTLSSVSLRDSREMWRIFPHGWCLSSQQRLFRCHIRAASTLDA